LRLGIFNVVLYPYRYYSARGRLACLKIRFFPIASSVNCMP